MVNRRPLRPRVGVIEGWGSSGHIATADDAFLAIVGYTRAEFERHGLNWRELTPMKLAHLDEAALRQAKMTSPAGGFTPAYQKALTRKDGAHVPVLVVCAIVPGSTNADADKADKWIAYVVDLSSELEQSWRGYAQPIDPQGGPGAPRPEEFHERLIGELVRERTRMAAMLDSTEAVIWAVDPDARLIAANATFQAVQRLASGRESVVGERLIAPRHAAEVEDEWQRAYARALDGERFSTRTVLDLPSGRRMHFENVISPIVHTEGNKDTVAGVAVVAHEVSKRVDIENALRESEARFRSLASGSPIGVFLSDPAGKNLYVNPRLASIWGIEDAEVFEEGWKDRIHPADRERVDRELECAIAEGRGLEIEFRLSSPAGDERHVHMWMAPIYHEKRITG
ncbi:MAG TPA: PAS domain S-box protein, partial [Labilithrix sp.]|nr:PAS domain S-box protein [Labilithrix sp.]